MVFFSIFFLSIPAYSVTCHEDPDDPNCTVTLPVTQVFGDDIGSGGGYNDGGWINPYDTGGQTGGGSSNGNMSQEKEDYCDQLDTLEGLLSGLLSGNNITGTAATGYSIAEGSAGIAYAVINAGYRDIGWYWETDRQSHAPMTYTDGVINWYAAWISWPLNSFNYIKGNPQPTLDNGGLQHIFAVWVQSIGQGNGTSVLTDPEPGTECP